MSKTTPAIRGVKARAVVVPLKRPVKNAFGIFTTGPLVLIDVETDQGVTGRTVVLALTNRAAAATVFHLHGHHFRLLDRLDDGWKPFWLDTLAIEPGQTQRIAFLAEHAGPHLIESVATDWAAPRLVRWYAVE